MLERDKLIVSESPVASSKGCFSFLTLTTIGGREDISLRSVLMTQPDTLIDPVHSWVRADCRLVDLDVAYIPTPKLIVHQMLNLAQLRRGETVYDLGAGDGRVLIEAARGFGARAVGIEIDPVRVNRIRERLKLTSVDAEVIEKDFMDIDLSRADVITIYLSETANAKLSPKLSRELKPGARVVSLDYTLPGWSLDREKDVESGGVKRKLYLYMVSKTLNQGRKS